MADFSWAIRIEDEAVTITPQDRPSKINLKREMGFMQIPFIHKLFDHLFPDILKKRDTRGWSFHKKAVF